MDSEPSDSTLHPHGTSRSWAACPVLCEHATTHCCLCASGSPGSGDVVCSLLRYSTSHAQTEQPKELQSAVTQDSAPRGQGKGTWAPIGGALMFYEAVRLVYTVEDIFRKHNLLYSSKQWRGKSIITPICLTLLREVRTFTQCHRVKWLKRTQESGFTIQCCLQTYSVAIKSPPLT